MLEKQRVITKSLLKDNSQIQRLDIYRAFFLICFRCFTVRSIVTLIDTRIFFQVQPKNNNPTKKEFVFVPVPIYRYQKLIDV